MAISFGKIRNQLISMRATILRQEHEIQVKDDEIFRLRNKVEEIRQMWGQEIIKHDDAIAAMAKMEFTISEDARIISRLSSEIRSRVMSYEILRKNAEKAKTSLEAENARLKEECEAMRQKAIRAQRAADEMHALYDACEIQKTEIAEKLLRINRLNKHLGEMVDSRNAKYEDACEELFFVRCELTRMENENAALVKRINDLEDQIIEEESREIEHMTVEMVPSFENVPDFAGFAPCGNGCHVKRDRAGSLYEEHKVTCEEHEDFLHIV